MFNNPLFTAYVLRLVSYAREYVLFGSTMALDPERLWIYVLLAGVGLAIVAALEVKYHIN